MPLDKLNAMKYIRYLGQEYISLWRGLCNIGQYIYVYLLNLIIYFVLKIFIYKLRCLHGLSVHKKIRKRAKCSY